MLFQIKKRLTFRQRLLRDAIFWGVPMLCLDLIGVPFWGWRPALEILVPATFVAMLAVTALEHFLISASGEAK